MELVNKKIVNKVTKNALDTNGNCNQTGGANKY